MNNWTYAEVVQIKHHTDNLFSLSLNTESRQFTAGQFTKLGLIIDNERITRAYSYVNEPKSNWLEFYIVKVDGGQLSSQLQKCQRGDQLLVHTQSSGYFTLNEIPTANTLWLLSTGTGIAPYLSMLQYGQDLERFENIVLVHAVRLTQDLSYLPLMQMLKQRYKNKLHIQTVISREQTNYGLHGRIPQLIQHGELEQRVGLAINAEQSHVMLCGNPDMIMQTQQILKTERQMHKHLRRKPGQITSEHYW